MVRMDDSQLLSLRNSSTKNLTVAAHRIVDQASKESLVFDTDGEAKIPRFELNELVLGHVLGRGGFCAVRELNSIKVQKDEKAKSKSKLNKIFCFRDNNLDPACVLGDHDHDGHEIGESETDATSDASPHNCREHLSSQKHKYKSKRSLYSSSSQYVVKQVNLELQHLDKVAFLKAMVDIELEAKYMSSFRHPNILSIRGLSHPNPKDGQSFLILDRLKETLGKRLQDWLRIHRQCKGITGMVTGSKKKKVDLLVDRLVTAHNIADAVDYLHSKNVMFRDLKPDNIGYDKSGCLKLFDFGLAREIKAEDRVDGTDLYRLTGLTGAVRYMAPEVGLRKPYNFKADVYSWSQLMWYILELEPPLGVYTPQMFKDRVFRKGTRPAVMDWWPEHMAELMKRCWSPNIKERPSFKQIKVSLSAIMLPYKETKLLPNRFGEEPEIIGKNSAASLSESSIPSRIGTASPNPADSSEASR